MMDADQKQIALCIYCLTRYRVPAAYEGKRVFCKNCGGYFDLVFNDATDNEADAPDSGNDTKQTAETQEIFEKDSRLLLGNLALKYNMLSEDEMKLALYLQQEKRDTGKNMLLGEILVAHKMITQAQLKFLLSVQEMLETHELDQKFGEIAIENRFVDAADIEQALSIQKRMFQKNKSVQRLGDILVRSGTLTQEQRDAILVKQERIKRIAPDDHSLLKESRSALSNGKG